MFKGRLFSWRRDAGFFLNRRGSMVVWLISAICFVIVFLAVAFALLWGKMSDKKTRIATPAFHREIRKPLKRYAVSNPTVEKSEEPGPESGTPLKEDLREKTDEGVEKPLNDDPSRMQDVLPDDPPGKGILSQELESREPAALSGTGEDLKTPAPPSTTEPPMVAASPQPADRISPSGNDEKALAASPGVSGPSDAGKTPAAEGLPEANVASEKKDGDKLTVTAVKGNIRKGPSVKEKILFTVVRGDTVQVTGEKGKWYEVLLDDGRSGWAHRSLLHVPSLPKDIPSGPETGKEKVIRGIRTVVTDPDHAQIVFELNGCYPPKIMVIEGSKPRVVCDFFRARLAPGVKKNLAVKTGLVKRIRVGIHRGATPKVRVVLDLQPGRNYAVEQFFFEKENFYTLMVNSGK